MAKKHTRVVLITSGLSPAAQFFSTLPGTPVGIINWNNDPVENDAESELGTVDDLKNRVIATIRKRKYASLQHLCKSERLHYADIYKRDSEKLSAVLKEWGCDLVVTSRCSFVPTSALSAVRHGAINLHPSWLPDYRGADPLLWHVVEKQESVATSIHVLTDEYDQGAVLAQKRLPRPKALSKAALSQLTESVLAKELLSSVISDLNDNKELSAIEQPVDSPTRYARRETPESFAQAHPVNELDPEVVWDLLHFFGYCPEPWLQLQGWRQKFQWRADGFLKGSDVGSVAEKLGGNSSTQIVFQRDGSVISLKPRYSSLLRR